MSGRSPPSEAWLVSSVSRKSGFPSVRRYRRSVCTGVERAAEYLAGELARFPPGQPRQVEPLHPFDPVQLGDQRPQRVGAVQIVRPVRHHDEHIVQGALVPDQEGEQVPAGPVGPVRVLDDQDDRGQLGQLFQQHEHLLEQPGPGLALVPDGRWLAELGQQPGQLLYGPARQQLGDLLGAQLAHQVPQHGGERRERQAIGSQLQAPADQHPGPGPPLGRGEFADEPGLADARLATDEDGRGGAFPYRSERGAQAADLARPADQGGADGTRAHAVQHAIRH